MDKKPYQTYVTRNYRAFHQAHDLRYFNITIKETDLAIGVDIKSYTDSLIFLCQKEVIKLRDQLENYISLHPEFRTSFFPIDLLPVAPEITRIMADASAFAGVGPMAAVAGAIAQAVGEKLRPDVNEVIVENGGDIYINSSISRTIAIYAGKSPFSNKIGIKIDPLEGGQGICTSSGTVGPSVSFGKADAIVIRGLSAALADAVATRACNLVQSEKDLLKAINYAKNINGINGILAIKEDQMAAWGSIEIIPLKGVNNS